MAKKYVVKLTEEERCELEELVRRGRSAGWKIQRAQALLKCDQSSGAPAWTDARISESFSVTVRSIENWRKRAVHEGPLALLERKPRSRPPVEPLLDGDGEAQLTKIACSAPPEGAARWTLQLLVDRLVELEVVPAISRDTVRRCLKKAS